MAFGGYSKDFPSAKIYSDCSPADESVDIKNEESMQCEQNPCSSKMDDVKSSTDSISSGSSMSDSDVTSTDSEDSLALSESESITDVTPLNSPYCDSPLHQSKIQDPKYEDKLGCAMKNLDISPPKETNVLMKAIEKLEVESNLKKGHLSVNRNVARKKKAVSFTGDDMRRVEQENQRLFKRVISQQNRIKVVPPNQTGHKNLSITRHQELRKSDGDISVIPKKAQTQKEESRSHIRRQQKCLSHPSSYPYACSNKVLMSVNSMNKGTSKQLQELPGGAIVSTAPIAHDCIVSNFSDMQE